MYYKLNPTRDSSAKRKYTKAELIEMTTVQLRNICIEERIIKGVVNTLDRESLIETILRYRSAEESLLIKDFKEDGFKRVSEMMKKYLITMLPNKGEIKIPAKIMLYPEIGLKKEDKYKVIFQKKMYQSNVLLINENSELCGIFNLEKDEKDPKVFYLTVGKNLKMEKSNNRHYSFLFFKKDDSEYIYKTYYTDKILPPANIEYYRITIEDIEIMELQDTNTVLAIDFGTTNTSAGAYLGNNYITNPCYNDIMNERIKLNEINFVRFSNIAKEGNKMLEILPTVVYIADCSDEKNIKYLFGYEAQKVMKKNNYTCNASVFQGIKRWINNYTAIEEIFDEDGNIAHVSRSEIIRNYIKYVIKTAEHQFKCRFKNLHISSPVKLKEQFLGMFIEIFPEYKIEAENALDEGLAVLYNTIADQIEKNNFEDGEEYKALIIDCGGGTTDLSSCSFRIEEGSISYKVNINTMYENGDTNFGGNNITYRIMQFMKIIFANYYRNRKAVTDIDKLIDMPSADIFRYVDEIGVEKVYEVFEKSYEAAEEIIPTKYKEYENKVRDDYQIVKNNFYFLWEIADNMKKQFYQRTNILRNRFDSTATDEDSDMAVTSLSKWNLSILERGQFRRVYEFPHVVFNIKEINKLIMGDIYEVVRKFLDSFYQSRKLQEYNIIKLTGQSCRIDIFKEALKEFVPGKSIEFKQKKEEDEIVSDLKLACLRGVIRFINSKKLGDIEVTIKNEIPAIPYSITAFTYNKQEQVLISSLEKMDMAKGYISRPIGTEEIEFYLKGIDDTLKQNYTYINDHSCYKGILPDEIEETYKNKILQEDTDTISNGEVRFFVFTYEKSWGFHVVPVSREDEKLYVGKDKFFAFENDLSELDFFDGLK